MKIIDSFLFFNEFDMVKLRINYLKDVVDYFIVSESDHTFSGTPKPYYFDLIMDSFPEDVQTKIIRIKHSVDSKIQLQHIQMPGISDYNNSAIWRRERAQRELITESLHQFSADDFFILSDVDEIPNKEILLQTANIFNETKLDFTLGAVVHSFMYSFVNYASSSFVGPVFSSIRRAIADGCDLLRSRRSLGNLVFNAGWHFSYFGTVYDIQNKIKAYSHQEFNKEELLAESNLAQILHNRKSIFDSNLTLRDYSINEFPEELKAVIIKVFNKNMYQKIPEDPCIQEFFSSKIQAHLN